MQTCTFVTMILAATMHVVSATEIPKDSQQPEVQPGFKVTIEGTDLSSEWIGQGPFKADRFRTGHFPRLTQLSMTVKQNDLRSELLIKTDVSQLMADMPETTHIETRCAIAVGEECIVAQQDQPIVLVKRTR